MGARLATGARAGVRPVAVPSDVGARLATLCGVGARIGALAGARLGPGASSRLRRGRTTPSVILARRTRVCDPCMGRVGDAARAGGRTGAVRSAARIGDAVRSGTWRTGDAVRSGTGRTGDAVRSGARTGDAVRSGARASLRALIDVAGRAMAVRAMAVAGRGPAGRVSPRASPLSSSRARLMDVVGRVNGSRRCALCSGASSSSSGVSARRGAISCCDAMRTSRTRASSSPFPPRASSSRALSVLSPSGTRVTFCGVPLARFRGDGMNGARGVAGRVPVSIRTNPAGRSRAATGLRSCALGAGALSMLRDASVVGSALTRWSRE